MQTLTEIRQLLEAHGVRPKHRFGQNFLHDKNQLTKLLDAANVQPGDVVLEVGPGTGTLTSALLERDAEVIACEIDPDMANIIEEVFAPQMRHPTAGSSPAPGTLSLIKADAIEKGRRLHSQIIEAIANRNFKLVANLPYQIASPLITTLLIDHPNCSGEFITIQKEVAERLLARPGTKDFGPLTIIVQAFAKVQKIGVLSPSCFWPAPAVTSAMVAIIPDSSNPMNPEERSDFAQFVAKLFTKRRKQLGTIFGRSRTDWPAGITHDLRPDALSVQQHIELWRWHAAGEDEL